MPFDAFMVRVAAEEYMEEQEKPRNLRRTLTVICHQRGLFNLGEVLDMVADLRGDGKP